MQETQTWKNLSQDKLLDFVSHVFKESVGKNIINKILQDKDKEENLCIFRTSRNQHKTCDNEATTPYGYCDSHIKTIQGKTACSKWNELSKENKKPAKKEAPKEKAPPKKETPPKEIPTEETENEPDSSEFEVFLNDFDRYEHAETGILIDIDNGRAYGVQNKDGSFRSLKNKEVEFCIQVGLGYELPNATYLETEKRGKVIVEEESDEDEEENEEEEYTDEEIEFTDEEE